MAGAQEVFALAKECGALTSYVSGAGSTIMAVVEASHAEAFYAQAEQALAKGAQTSAFTLKRLVADNIGATVES